MEDELEATNCLARAVCFGSEDISSERATWRKSECRSTMNDENETGFGEIAEGQVCFFDFRRRKHVLVLLNEEKIRKVFFLKIFPIVTVPY